MLTYLPSRWNKGIDLVHIDLRTDEQKWDSINRQIKFRLHENYMIDTVWYLPKQVMNYKKNLILVLVITGMIRVLFVAGSMGAIIWCRHTNCVSDYTESIKKQVLNTFINISLLFMLIDNRSQDTTLEYHFMSFKPL